MVPQVEFDNLGAQGGTQWHQLDHVEEEPAVSAVDLHQIGAGGGRDWRELRPLGQPVDHSGYKSVKHHKKRPE